MRRLRIKNPNYRYSLIPAAAVTDPNVAARDLQVLCLLGRHTKQNGWCKRSQVKMAAELSCGRATVQRALENLASAGYVQKRLNGRGNAEANPKKQPFASYSYRVSLDPDDIETADLGGAHQWAPDYDDLEEEFDELEIEHQGARPRSGTRAPTSRAPLTEPATEEPAIKEPSSAREEFAARWEEIKTAFERWDANQTGWSLSRAKVVAEQMADELPRVDVLVACIVAEGAAIASANKTRRGDPLRVTHPHNWLKRDRGWEKHLAAVADAPRRVAAGVAKATAVRARLGEYVVTRLKRAGITDEVIGKLEGCEFIDGVLHATPIGYQALAGREMKLLEVFDDEFSIVVDRVRSAA